MQTEELSFYYPGTNADGSKGISWQIYFLYHFHYARYHYYQCTYPETSYHYHRHILTQVAYLAASDAVKHKNKTSLQ